MSIWKTSKQDVATIKCDNKPYVAGYSKEEWERLANQFKKDYELFGKHIKDFGELVTSIIGTDTSYTFQQKTGLTRDMFYRLRSRANTNNPPKKNTIISFAVGYDLDIAMTRSLFVALGLDFNYHNDKDYAYIWLLTRCRGKDIEECNEILDNLNIDEKYQLGHHASKKRSA